MNPQLTQLQVQRSSSVNSDQQSAANGRWLVFARICWLALAALALIIFASSLPPYFRNLQQVCNSYSCSNGQLMLQSAQILQNLGISVGNYAVFTIILTIIIALVWFVVGGLIFWRKSDERVALVVSLGLVLYVSQSGDAYLLTVNNPIWMILVTFVQFLATVALFLVLFLFPDGHFVPRWTRWFAVGFILIGFDAGLSNFMPTWPLNPWILPLSPFFIALLIIYSIGLAISQVYRYRRISSPVQRRQTRLVFLALSIYLLGFFVDTVLLLNLLPDFFPALMPPDPLNQLLTIFLQNILPLVIPISFGIAMFRYRLWDIDIIINRTLVYGTLTSTLVALYVGSILILQALLSGFTSGNAVALVVSTLAIAALFQPFRRRIQTIIDRRFYRRKYNAARTIAAFSATLRAEVDLDTLSEQLVAVVEETMQPAHVSLWLQQRDRQGRQRYVGLTAEKAPSQQSVSPIPEPEVTENTEELPGPPSRGISRRAVLIGLAVGGVVVTGGGLSWWLLRRHASFIYTGHTDWVYDVAWSPDGKRIVSCSKDTTAQVWDASTGSRIFTYRGHASDVYTVAWSPDGKRIASCSQDHTVQVWDASDGGHILTYPGHTDAVVSVAWSPNGTLLASGGGNVLALNHSHDTTVQVWNATDGSHVFTYHGHSDAVEGVVWSPDGRRIASASLDKTVQVWDATDGGYVLTYRGHKDQVFTVAWSPNGKYLASGGANFDPNSPTRDITAQVWDATTGDHLFTYTGHTDWVDGVAWSPYSRRIASASSDKTVQVWDALNGDHVFVYNGHSSAVSTAAWSPDGTRVASASFDDTVQIWSPG